MREILRQCVHSESRPGSLKPLKAWGALASAIACWQKIERMLPNQAVLDRWDRRARCFRGGNDGAAAAGLLRVWQGLAECTEKARDQETGGGGHTDAGVGHGVRHAEARPAQSGQCGGGSGQRAAVVAVAHTAPSAGCVVRVLAGDAIVVQGTTFADAAVVRGACGSADAPCRGSHRLETCGCTRMQIYSRHHRIAIIFWQLVAKSKPSFVEIRYVLAVKNN